MGQEENFDEILMLQIECDAGLPDFKESQQAEDYAAKLMRLFKSCHHLYQHTDEKDRGPADDLPALAVTALVAAWKLDPSKQPKHLLQVRHMLKFQNVDYRELRDHELESLDPWKNTRKYTVSLFTTRHNTGSRKTGGYCI